MTFDYPTLKATPGLAESWKFTDPKTLVMTIRSGVQFHDGTPLDAEAVKFNLDRNKSDPRSSIKADLGTVEKAIKVHRGATPELLIEIRVTRQPSLDIETVARRLCSVPRVVKAAFRAGSTAGICNSPHRGLAAVSRSAA